MTAANKVALGSFRPVQLYVDDFGLSSLRNHTNKVLDKFHHLSLTGTLQKGDMHLLLSNTTRQQITDLDCLSLLRSLKVENSNVLTELEQSILGLRSVRSFKVESRMFNCFALSRVAKKCLFHGRYSFIKEIYFQYIDLADKTIVQFGKALSMANGFETLTIWECRGFSSFFELYSYIANVPHLSITNFPFRLTEILAFKKTKLAFRTKSRLAYCPMFRCSRHRLILPFLFGMHKDGLIELELPHPVLVLEKEADALYAEKVMQLTGIRF